MLSYNKDLVFVKKNKKALRSYIGGLLFAFYFLLFSSNF